MENGEEYFIIKIRLASRKSRKVEKWCQKTCKRQLKIKSREEKE